MVYFIVGIKGAALSALAKILSDMGHIVRGVDVEEEFYTLNDKNHIQIESFSNMKLKKSYFYIIGNAYKNHSVARYIQKMKYYFLSYPDFLNYYFKNQKWIGVSGTSGKTTTTKMLSTLLPTCTSLIGDGTYRVGTGDYFIIESCEYKNTFLKYHPYISLVLNVNYDHVDFFKTKEEYEKSFIKFIQQSTLCIVNGDSLSYRNNNVITYGLDKTNDIPFSYHHGKVTLLRKTFTLPVLGIQYAYDFVGAYLVAKLLDEKDFIIQQKINQFIMPKRRFEKKEINTQLIISDYAHHPKEIDAIFHSLLEQYPSKKKICIFEPHTLTRLSYFLEEYKAILGQFDECYLYPLFSSAREKHDILLEKRLYRELGFPIYEYIIQQRLLKEKNCVLCFLGAGVIDRACNEYKRQISVD